MCPKLLALYNKLNDVGDEKVDIPHQHSLNPAKLDDLALPGVHLLLHLLPGRNLAQHQLIKSGPVVSNIVHVLHKVDIMIQSHKDNGQHQCWAE